MKILWIFIWGHHNWASLKVISMQFMVLFKVKVQNWDIFGLLKFQLFFWSA